MLHLDFVSLFISVYLWCIVHIHLEELVHKYIACWSFSFPISLFFCFPLFPYLITSPKSLSLPHLPYVLHCNLKVIYAVAFFHMKSMWYLAFYVWFISLTIIGLGSFHFSNKWFKCIVFGIIKLCYAVMLYLFMCLMSIKPASKI